MNHKSSIVALIAALAFSMVAGCAGIAPASKGGIRLEHVAINVPDPVAMAHGIARTSE